MTRSPVIPESLQAYADGWDIIDRQSTPFQVLTEKEMKDSFLKAPIRDTLTKIQRRVSSQLSSRALPLTDANIFKYLVHKAMDLL